MYQQILLASDGTDNAVKAAEKAFELAKLSGGRVEIVYVIDGETSKHDVLRHANSPEIELERRGKLRSTEELARKTAVPYEVSMLHGSPAKTICDYAQTQNMDVIVMGNRGVNALQELVLGSVSHQVIHKSNRPVMVVK
ncbi:universal stress protein [Pseudalkalibacillus hwajinpoensis]|uniref:universal stress protein n=1 Tax=Guptibacillus hwajinpoensis TaxID=208199 RepID=UPI001CFF2094|nr:universal stress protein [Pseudalkalibacillus hwajinpoensis]